MGEDRDAGRNSPGERVIRPPSWSAAVVDRFRPEEWIAAIYAVVVAGLLLLRGLPFTVGSLVGNYALFLGSILVLALPAWAVGQVVAARRGGFEAAGARHDLASLARSLVPVLVVLVTYTNLKGRLVQLRSTLFDSALERLDAWLHFGGGDFIGWLLGSSSDRGWMEALGFVYFYAWVALAIPFAASLALRGAPAARRILFALALIYIAGGFLYLALPSVGPAFVWRERYAVLEWGLPFRIQQSMLAAMVAVARDPSSPAVPFFGIAAFPSLHLATTGIGLFAAGRWCRPLLFLLVPLNLAIAWSALVWGWHYAIDFYAGLLLAWAGWRVSGWILERNDRACRNSRDDRDSRAGAPAGGAPPSAGRRAEEVGGGADAV